MKNLKVWAVLVAALMLIVGCRPTGETDIPGTAELTLTEDGEAVCEPEDTDCEEEPTAGEAAAEQVEGPTTAPAEQAASEQTAETPVNPDDPFAIRDSDWVMGPDDALITLLEYGDYQ